VRKRLQFLTAALLSAFFVLSGPVEAATIKLKQDLNATKAVTIGETLGVTGIATFTAIPVVPSTGLSFNTGNKVTVKPAANPGQVTTLNLADPGAATGYVHTYAAAQSSAGVLSRADIATQTSQKYAGSLTLVRNLNGTVVDATGGAGKFSVSTTATFGSPATLTLKSEDTQNTTKTDVGEFEFRLPPEYVAGAAVTVNVTCNVTGSGTLGSTHSVTVDAFKLAADGTAGSNIGPAAQTTLATGSAATLSFTVTPTGLVAGDKLLIQVQTSISESGNASPINANITALDVALSIKG
jgi:hypothetical protein